MNCPKCDSCRFYFVQRVYEYHTIDSIKNGEALLLDLDETSVDLDFLAYLYCSYCDKAFDMNQNEIEQPEIIDVPISMEEKSEIS